MNHENSFTQALELIPGGVHSPVRSFKGLDMPPRFMLRGDGAFLFDIENKNYIDFCMSFGPLILGHRDPEVFEQLVHALDRGWSFGTAETYSLELAHLIVSKISFIDQIRFVNSGTEAVMTALRLARGHTGKNKIIKFNGCYHGHVDSMLIKAGSGLAGTAESSSKGVSSAIASETLILELGDLNLVEECFKQHKDDIAAIIIEPLPANNGLLIQEQSFLEGVRDLCDRYRALLIFDEVISGFRVAFGGMAELTGIHPDIVTYGKIIGGGLPVGAIAARKEIMSHLAPLGEVYQAGTLSANPLAMIGGLSTLKKCTSSFYQSLEQISLDVCSHLSDWLREFYPQFLLIQKGSLFWILPGNERINKASEIPPSLTEEFKPMFKSLLERGIYLSPNAYEVGFVSLAHGEKTLDELKKRLWS